jgi:hypothetical protein
MRIPFIPAILAPFFGGFCQWLQHLGITVSLLLLVLMSTMLPARASDHQDTSFLGCRFPAGDLTDLYVFESPDPNNAVLAMDFDPFIPRGADRPFDPSLLYQFKVDTTVPPDGLEELVLQFQFSGTAPNQSITMYGPAAPNVAGSRSTLLATARGSGPVNQVLNLPGGVKLFAGLRKDPFFFDLERFFEIIPDRNYLLQPNPAPPFQVLSFRPPGQAMDMFADFNVHSIVVELPRQLLGGGRAGVYMSISLPEQDFANVPPTGTVFAC